MLNSIYAPIKQSGNGSNLAFSFPWKILAASDLAVFKIDAAGNQSALLVNGIDYTVLFDPILESGTVTYTIAPVSGGFSLITRVSNNQQATSLPREGSAPAKTTETMIDKLQMEIQELQITGGGGGGGGGGTPIIATGTYAALKAAAASNPLVPFLGFASDISGTAGEYTQVFYTGNPAAPNSDQGFLIQ